MNYTLKRIFSNNFGTFGIINDLFVTLEPVSPIIPKGRYICKRRFSNKFNKELFEVTEVPGHTDVEIHIGNSVKDTHGCILLGLGLDLDDYKIYKSIIAFNKFMDLLKGINEFTLEII